MEGKPVELYYEQDAFVRVIKIIKARTGTVDKFEEAYIKIVFPDDEEIVINFEENKLSVWGREYRIQPVK